MHEVLVNRLGGLSLPRKSVVRLTDRPDMTKIGFGKFTKIQNVGIIHSNGSINKASLCFCSFSLFNVVS